MKTYQEIKPAAIDTIIHYAETLLGVRLTKVKKNWYNALCPFHPDTELWRTHYLLKVKLIDAIRERTRQRWAKADAGISIMLAGGTLLDPSVLTLGPRGRNVLIVKSWGSPKISKGGVTVAFLQGMDVLGFLAELTHETER